MKRECSEALAKYEALANLHTPHLRSKGGCHSGVSWGMSAGEEVTNAGAPAIFEYFETRAPGDRPPLFDCVRELAAASLPAARSLPLSLSLLWAVGCALDSRGQYSLTKGKVAGMAKGERQRRQRRRERRWCSRRRTRSWM